jgi:hypothetical protein
MSLIAWIALGVVVALVLLFIFLPVVAWILVGLVLLVLAVVLFVPVGADIGYVGGEFRLSARVDGFALQLSPKKPPDPDKPPKEKKPRKEKPQKPKEPKPEEEAKPKKKRFEFTKEELFELAQKVLKGLGKFGKLTVRRFMLHYVAAGEDPCDTAVTFNYVNAALSTLAPICARIFRVTGEVDVWTDVDFTTDKMRLDAELSMTLRLVQLVHMGLAIAFGVLGVLIKNKLRLRKEAKLAKNSTTAISDEETVNTNSDTIQAEERNDLHG